MGLIRWLALRLGLPVRVGSVTREGWRGSLPFYAFMCPKHGEVFNYPQGYNGRLDCPVCLRERRGS